VHSIGTLPFGSKSLRETGVSVRPVHVRHGSAELYAMPALFHTQEGHGYVVRIMAGRELLETLEGSGFPSAEIALQEADSALQRFQLEGDDPESSLYTPRGRSRALRRKLWGY